jgi:hypothetical protein
MPPKPNPFSLYDFLGYFTPGATALYIFYFYIDASSTRLDPVAASIHDAATLQEPAFLIPFVLLAYIIGHVLSFASSITVELYSVWVFDYPSKELLGAPRKGFLEKDVPLRLLNALLLAPIVIWDAILRLALRLEWLFSRSLDPLLADLVKKKVSRLVKELADESDPIAAEQSSNHEFFRLVYHYAVEHAPNHLPKMQNYVALYGFLRTMTFLGVIVFWVVLVTFAWWANDILDVVRWASAISAVTFVLFLAFVKFYRRFSLEALMAVSVTYPRRT